MRFNAGLPRVLADGTNTYLYGLGRLAERQSGVNDYYLGDALGSVRQLTNNSGEITLTRRYDPYGTVGQSGGFAQTEYGFTGEATDASGLIYLRARYYSGETGRFLSRDTWNGDVKRPLSLNKWMYVEGNPVNRVDPSGMCYTDPNPFSKGFWERFWDEPFLGPCSAASPQSQNSPATSTPLPTNTTEPTPTCTPTVIPTPAPTSTVEQRLFDLYGVKLVDGNLTWSSRNKEIALIAVEDISNRMGSADRFRSKFNANASSPIFLIMGTSAPDIVLSEQCKSIGAGGCTTSSHKINFASLSQWYVETARNNIVHELGHAFNGGHGELPSDSMPEEYVRQRSSILLPTETFVWQQNPTKTRSETFADFFVAWTYDAWQPATDDNGITIAGKARNWMNEGMAGW